MSWLFKSLQFPNDNQNEQSSPPQNDDVRAVPPTIGLKDDLSAITETIGRQFRGVAAFLAPPPPPETAVSTAASGGAVDNENSLSSLSPQSSSPSRTFAGIRNDLAEIGGTFKNSLSLISSTGISKFASGLLQFNDNNDVNIRGGDVINEENEDYDDEGVGISDEVIEFATQVSQRPELWTDFPLKLNHDFDMSDVQIEHVSVIEQLVPSLADLRGRLSSDMSDNQFWMIYFILLLPRLNEDDMELLSTPEVVEARETLLLLLRTNKDTEMDEINSQNPQKDYSAEKSRSVEKVTISEGSNASRSEEINESDNTKEVTEEEDGNPSTPNDHKQPGARADGTETNRILPSKETAVVDSSNVRVVNEEHENVDQLLHKEEAVTTGTSTSAPKQFQSEDDVSFSDLEDDDNDLPSRPSGSGRAHSTRGSSPEGSNEWVRLNKDGGSRGSQFRGQSSSRDRDSESEDWLTVDDFDP